MTTSVDFSSFTSRDVADVALQRTATLLNWPMVGRLSYALWSKNRPELLNLEARLRRNSILNGAFRDVEAEFTPLAAYLADWDVRKLVDIGCGHALIDLLFYRRFGCSIHLVDIEQTKEHHHRFHRTGAGYASLGAASAFLRANGVPPELIRTTNPQRETLEDENCDVALSLLSCGFHYPAETYASFLDQALRPGGVFIFDMRRDTGQERFLEQFSSYSVLEETAKHRRLAAVK